MILLLLVLLSIISNVSGFKLKLNRNTNVVMERTSMKRFNKFSKEVKLKLGLDNNNDDLSIIEYKQNDYNNIENNINKFLKSYNLTPIKICSRCIRIIKISNIFLFKGYITSNTCRIWYINRLFYITLDD